MTSCQPIYFHGYAFPTPQAADGPRALKRVARIPDKPPATLAAFFVFDTPFCETDMPLNTDELRIRELTPLTPPATLLAELPLDDATSATVAGARAACHAILHGEDDRLVVIAQAA